MTARPRRENPSNGSRSPLTLLEQVKARAKARPKLVRVADVMEMAGSLKGFHEIAGKHQPVITSVGYTAGRLLSEMCPVPSSPPLTGPTKCALP